MNDELDLLVELAMEVESSDPIDWEGLNINKKDAYYLIGSSVLEMKADETIYRATITKLLVENFALNLKILKSKGES